MLLLRSLLFYIVMALATVVYTPVAFLTFPFRFRTRFYIITSWGRLNLHVLAWVCNLRYEVEGRENLPETTAVAFCKHQSTWETLGMQKILPPQTWVLKRELLRIPFFGWGLAMLDPIAIDRASGRQALQQMVEQGKARLETDHWVVVFPEGTRMPVGKRRRFGYGGAKLAAESGHPVVPIAHNAGQFWRRRGFIKYPGVIQVKIGKPILTAGRKPADINAEAEAWIAKAMFEITGVEEEVVERKKAAA